MPYPGCLDKRQHPEMNLSECILQHCFLQFSLVDTGNIDLLRNEQSTSVVQPFVGIVIAADHQDVYTAFGKARQEAVQRTDRFLRRDTSIINVSADQDGIDGFLPNNAYNLIQHIFLIPDHREFIDHLPEMQISQM